MHPLMNIALVFVAILVLQLLSYLFTIKGIDKAGAECEMHPITRKLFEKDRGRVIVPLKIVASAFAGLIYGFGYLLDIRLWYELAFGFFVMGSLLVCINDAVASLSGHIPRKAIEIRNRIYLILSFVLLLFAFLFYILYSSFILMGAAPEMFHITLARYVSFLKK